MIGRKKSNIIMDEKKLIVTVYVSWFDYGNKGGL
jgi:hypothetical protein